MNRFVIADAKNCIGCRTCEVACVLAHSGNDIAAINPKNFSPRIKVVKSSTISTAILCRHCEDAPCAEVCPNGAIIRRNNSIQIIQEKCIGCKTCAIACPYGAMSIVTKTVSVEVGGGLMREQVKAEALKCDLCEGKEGGPSCINVCPTKALHLVTLESMDAMLQQKQLRAAIDEAKEFVF